MSFFKVTKYPQKRKLRCLAEVFVVGFFQSSSVFLEHWELGLYLVRGFVRKFSKATALQLDGVGRFKDACNRAKKYMQPCREGHLTR